ncbi:MAG: M12 family metallo-peptidase [Clostridiales bacterium]|nr:M12 family metallo-peptidase [Clostridiales bacterium]
MGRYSSRTKQLLAALLYFLLLFSSVFSGAAISFAEENDFGTEQESISPSALPNGAVLLGDASRDDAISAHDAASMLRHMAGATVLTDEVALLCADVNRDGQITAADAAALLRWLAGLENPSGLGQPHYYVLYNGNGHTAGLPPPGQLVKVGHAVTLRTNTGELIKAGCAPFTWWSTTGVLLAGGIYAPGLTITPTMSRTLYALWNPPLYLARTVKVKLWVDKSYRDAYPIGTGISGGDWRKQTTDIADRAAYSFYQTFNITMDISAPTAMDSPKADCTHTQVPCQIGPTCGYDCADHNSNADKIYQYVNDRRDSNYGINTLIYFGFACRVGTTRYIYGLGNYPWNGPATTIAMCQTSSHWERIRTVQHEWSHTYGAYHTKEDPAETPCTSTCIMDTDLWGWYDEPRLAPDVWCSRCKVAMAPYLGAHSP